MSLFECPGTTTFQVTMNFHMLCLIVWDPPSMCVSQRRWGRWGYAMEKWVQGFLVGCLRERCMNVGLAQEKTWLWVAVLSCGLDDFCLLGLEWTQVHGSNVLYPRHTKFKESSHATARSSTYSANDCPTCAMHYVPDRIDGSPLFITCLIYLSRTKCGMNTNCDMNAPARGLCNQGTHNAHAGWGGGGNAHKKPKQQGMDFHCLHMGQGTWSSPCQSAAGGFGTTSSH